MKTRALWLIFCLILTGCSLVTSQAADIKPTDVPTALPTMAAQALRQPLESNTMTPEGR